MEITGEMLEQAMSVARPYIKRLLGQRASETEDILQDACVKALRFAQGFDGKSKFSTWFCTIARNEALMLFRNRRSQSWEPLDFDWMSPRLNPEQVVLKKESTQNLIDSLLLLSPLLRGEMLRWAVGGESDTPPDTLKMRRCHAKRELRVMLEIE